MHQSSPSNLTSAAGLGWLGLGLLGYGVLFVAGEGVLGGDSRKRVREHIEGKEIGGARGPRDSLMRASGYT